VGADGLDVYRPRYDRILTKIRKILHRRTDLSTFVVHLTRRRDANYTAADALTNIARTRRLEARNPMGIAKQQDDPNDPTKQSQRVVCFSETPLEHVNLMCGPIEGRTVEMEPYGIALTKLKARKLGINPIWYLDTTPGRDWTLANTLDGVRDAAVRQAQAEGENFHSYAITALFPFIEQMGTWPSGSRKEFWWEREWRHAGHLDLPATALIWLCPEADIDRVNGGAGYELKPWLDPMWGLEEIIAHLSGFQLHDVTPFWND
jgi:Putative abortive phage resistance protein AbiGi, antitoxin